MMSGICQHIHILRVIPLCDICDWNAQKITGHYEWKRKTTFCMAINVFHVMVFPARVKLLCQLYKVWCPEINIRKQKNICAVEGSTKWSAKMPEVERLRHQSCKQNGIKGKNNWRGSSPRDVFVLCTDGDSPKPWIQLSHSHQRSLPAKWLCLQDYQGVSGDLKPFNTHLLWGILCLKSFKMMVSVRPGSMRLAVIEHILWFFK